MRASSAFRFFPAGSSNFRQEVSSLLLYIGSGRKLECVESNARWRGRYAPVIRCVEGIFTYDLLTEFPLVGESLENCVNRCEWISVRLQGEPIVSQSVSDSNGIERIAGNRIKNCSNRVGEPQFVSGYFRQRCDCRVSSRLAAFGRSRRIYIADVLSSHRASASL